MLCARLAGTRSVPWRCPPDSLSPSLFPRSATSASRWISNKYLRVHHEHRWSNCVVKALPIFDSPPFQKCGARSGMAVCLRHPLQCVFLALPFGIRAPGRCMETLASRARSMRGIESLFVAVFSAPNTYGKLFHQRGVIKHSLRCRLRCLLLDNVFGLHAYVSLFLVATRMQES